MTTSPSTIASGRGPDTARSDVGSPRRRSPATRKTASSRRSAPLWWGVIGTLTFLVLAEIVSRAGLIDSRYLPPISEILLRAVQLIGDPDFLADVGSTLGGWALSLIIAAAIAIPAGVALASSRVADLMTAPVINALRPIPAVALIPLAVLVWGSGLEMKVALTTFAIVWPILFNTMFGVRDVDPVTRETARAFGIPRRATLFRVVLPSAAPFIMTGLRVAASMGLVVIVGTELFAGATSGIGSFILLASAGGSDLGTVIAGAIWAGFLGVVINMVIGAVDNRYFRWARHGEEI